MSESYPERPILWGELKPAVAVPTRRGGEKKVVPQTPAGQAARLGARFSELEKAFDDQVTLTASLGASDPQLVLVFEGIDEREDLSGVAERAGLEVVSEVGLEFEPDPDFPRIGQNQDLRTSGTLHAVCINEQAKKNLLGLWQQWQSSGRVDVGYAPLKNLFMRLKDVRPWGPEDRVRVHDVAALLETLVPGDHEIEIELWFRRSEEMREQAQSEVAALIRANGGSVVSVAVLPEVGYHGMKCSVPLELLKSLAAGEFEAVQAVRSGHVMYLRISAQSLSISSPADEEPVRESPLPEVAEPVMCVLDGVPAANHAFLAGRVTVFDPDDLESASPSASRTHGTAMASVCVWGDLGQNEAPARRPVLVRPILVPSTEVVDSPEEIPPGVLPPDLMRRVFRELYDDGVGPGVVVINLSVADAANPFDGIVSSWARTLDWLASSYGVLVVVSAGNYGLLPGLSNGVDPVSLGGLDRVAAVQSAVARAVPRRSLLAPADSINALSVGAMHADAAGQAALLPYRFDPADGQAMVSPVSAIGLGHHRSIKPDLLAPGGRVFYRSPLPGQTIAEYQPAPHLAYGPGVRVASPTNSTAYTVGTSPAAAHVSRVAARAVDTAISIADRPLNRGELAVATKAMVAHALELPQQVSQASQLGTAQHGYGVLSRELTSGCDHNEAGILFVGQIGENESRTMVLPLPDGLHQQGLKRVTATLAWLSPVNWRHRQYRCAALEFSKPTGMTELGTAIGAMGDAPKRGTLQHVVWEVNKAVGVGRGSDLSLTVTCRAQAGGLHGQLVDFAVVLSLWVAPELGVDVYAQVREQLQSQVLVSPSP